ncbi:MAG: hypothetical protein OEM62_08645 [Acidobacteriota bacterium]|nr:hypothetical protein [Acidobacteriota bacterium]
MTSVLQLHAASTLAMTGLIWFVQIVHYPLFRFAAGEGFPGFATSHQHRTAFVVLPLMVTELATALLLAVAGGAGSKGLAAWGLALLAAIWLSTALVQVPLHRRLAQGFDGHAAGVLVKSNWLRTAAWSAKSVIALGMLAT